MKNWCLNKGIMEKIQEFFSFVIQIICSKRPLKYRRNDYVFFLSLHLPSTLSLSTSFPSNIYVVEEAVALVMSMKVSGPAIFIKS